MKRGLRPATADIVAAVEALEGTVLQRKEANFALWLALKRASAALGPEESRFRISNTDVAALCNDYFALFPTSGQVWYLPFSGRSYPMDGKANGGWPKSTVWRGIGDGRFVFPMLYSIASSGAPRGSADLDILPTYGEAIGRELGKFLANDTRIPLDALAIWRYRHGAPKDASTTEDLSQLLINELGIANTESAVLFM
jgi:hypothetical protein